MTEVIPFAECNNLSAGLSRSPLIKFPSVKLPGEERFSGGQMKRLFLLAFEAAGGKKVLNEYFLGKMEDKVVAAPRRGGIPRGPFERSSGALRTGDSGRVTAPRAGPRRDESG